MNVARPVCRNLFADIPQDVPEELFENLIQRRDWRLERIVSRGQATPPGEWYDQERDEWVLLLSGAAALRFEGETKLIELAPGDSVHIPAHCRHRVEWTLPGENTVWLALHFEGESE